MKPIVSLALAAGVLFSTVPMASAGPIESACMRSGREAASRALCGCIQQVADMTLKGGDQRRGGVNGPAINAGFAGDDVQAAASSRALFGDGLFAAGVLAAARAQAPRAPTYVYHFAHMQPFPQG